MDNLREDLRYAIRSLLKNRSFTIVALIVLSLGIGANSAIFSVVYSVLLKPLPYRDADRLLIANVSLPERRDLAQGVDGFDAISVWGTNLYTLAAAGDAEQIRGVVATTPFLSMLGDPLIGRTFDPSDDGQAVVVLSFDLWQKRFAGDRSVLGRSINLSRRDYTIIGVMPELFQFPDHTTKVWIPMGLSLASAPQQAENRGLRIFRALAHLRSGVTPAQVRPQVDAVSARLQREYPETNNEVQLTFTSLKERLVGDIRAALVVLLAAVGLILLIVCANIANLMLVRGTAREREIALRAALGASRIRVIRQLVTESLSLSVTGGMLGLLLAVWSIAALRSFGPADLPRLDEIELSIPVLMFTVALSLLSGLIFGMAPAFKASRVDLEQILKETGRNAVSAWGRRLRSGLVVVEIALSLMILVSAGLLLKSFDRLTRVDMGFQPDNLMVTNLELHHYAAASQRAAIAREVLQKISQVRGVQAVAGSSALPPVQAQRGTSFSIQGDSTVRTAYFIGVSSDYFRTIGAPVIRGRAFTPRDSADAPPVVIINKTMATRLFGDTDPTGKQMKLINPEQSDVWRTVVGVVSDIKYSGLDDPGTASVYTPFEQTPFLWSYILIRTSSDPGMLMPGVREAFTSVDTNALPRRVQYVTDLISESVSQPRFNTSLLLCFAVLAMALAATGLYGVISYSVTQQTRDIGIRIALGAGTRNIFGYTMRSAAMLTLIGITIGLAGAWVASRLLSSLLYEISATDALTYMSVAFILAFVSALASYFPARRAARVDPIVALRHE